MANTAQILKEAVLIFAANSNRDAGQRRLDMENSLAYTRSIAQAPEAKSADTEAKVGAIAVTSDFGADGLKRANEYAPKDGNGYICPVCWVKEAVKIRLRAGSDLRGQSLECPECKAPFPVAL